MPDKKLTDNEIINGLKCCMVSDCDNCTLRREPCSELIAIDKALDLINRLQAEKQNLEIELQAMRNAANGFKTENERLKEENQKQRLIIEAIDDNMFPLPFETDYDKAIKNAKAEAYKECIEKVKEILIGFPRPNNLLAIRESLDNLLKEMVGE